MEADATEINALRELLASGDITAEQLQKGSADAHELAVKLKAAGKTLLAAEVEALAEKLDDAVHSNLDAAAKKQRQQVGDLLKTAITKGLAIALNLGKNGLTEDAEEISKSIRLVTHVMTGKIPPEELDDAVEALKEKITKLKGEGHTAEATELETLLEVLERAQTAQMESEALRRKDNYILAAADAAKKEAEAADAAAIVETHLLAAKLSAEAAQIQALWQKLEPGGEPNTGEGLRAEGQKAHALAQKLREMGHKDLANEVEHLAQKLDDTALASLKAARLKATDEAGALLQECLELAQQVEDECWAAGQEDTAHVMENLVNMIQKAYLQEASSIDGFQTSIRACSNLAQNPEPKIKKLVLELVPKLKRLCEILESKLSYDVEMVALEMALHQMKETDELTEVQGAEDAIDAKIKQAKAKAASLRSKGYLAEVRAENRKIEAMQLAKLAFEKRRRDYQRKQCTIQLDFALSENSRLAEALKSSRQKAFLGDCESLKKTMLEAKSDPDRIRCDLIAAAAESIVPIHHRMALEGCTKERLDGIMVTHKALSSAATAGLDAEALDMKIQAAMLLIDAVGVGEGVISTLRGSGAEDDAKKVEAVMMHLDQARKGKFEFSVTIADDGGGQEQNLDDCKKALTKEMSSSSSRLRRTFNKRLIKKAK